MKDFREEWFMNQWFSKEELEKLWSWSLESNKIRAKEVDGKYLGYHVLDKDFEIDLVSMPTEKDCQNWIKRLGFEVA